MITVEAREIVRLAVPLSVAQVAIILFGLIDTLTFSSFGISTLAAGGLGVAVFSLINIIAVGVLTAVGNQVAWLKGKNSSSDLSAVIGAGLQNAFFVGLVLFSVLAMSEPLLIAFGQDPAIVGPASDYLLWAGFSLFPTLVFTVYRGLLTGLSNALPVTLASILGVVIKLSANGIIVAIAAPEDAMAYIGLSSTLAFFGMAAALFIYSSKTYPSIHAFRSDAAKRKLAGREGLSLGIPIAGSYGVEAGLFTGAALMAGTISDVALAAHHIANQFVYLTFMLAVGISHATSVRIGNAAGAGDFVQARVAAKTGLGVGIVTMTFMALLFASAGSILVSWLLPSETESNAEVAGLATTLLLIAACFQWSDGVQNIAMGALRGLKRAKTTLLGNILGYWVVGLPCAALGLKYAENGLYGIWWGLAAGLTTTAIFLTWQLSVAIRQQHPDQKTITIEREKPHELLVKN